MSQRSHRQSWRVLVTEPAVIKSAAQSERKAREVTGQWVAVERRGLRVYVEK